MYVSVNHVENIAGDTLTFILLRVSFHTFTVSMFSIWVALKLTTLLGSKEFKKAFVMSMHNRKVIHKESTRKNTETVIA